MAWRVSCPYCNAVLSVEPTDRTTCTRCDEAFDPNTAEQLPDETAVAAVPTAPAKGGFLYSRNALFLSFGLAALILAVGLAVIRPWEPRVVPKPQESKLPVVVSPLGLSGLAYLPARTNALAAVQPLPLLAYAAQSKTDPKKFLIDAGVPEMVFAKLSQAGLPLDQIDHLVVGMAVGSEKNTLIPGLTVCLKLTRPIADESKFLAQLKAEKNSQQSKGGRTVYSVPAGLPLLMTRIDESTYLFGLGAEDLEQMDKPLAAGGGHLPKELREAMTSKISPASFVWVASDSDKWAEKLARSPFTAAVATKEQLAKLAPLRAVAAGLSIEPEPQLRLGVRMADAAATAAVQTRLKATFPVAVADPEWATVQAPFDPKAASLKTLLADLFAAKP